MKYHIWSITYEVSHMKYHIWSITYEVSHMKYHILDLLEMLLDKGNCETIGGEQKLNKFKTNHKNYLSL
jgi:hypothetical protein